MKAAKDKVVPIVGMGCTLVYHSDRSPATVVEVKSPTTIVIQEDKYTRTDNNGMSENQSYTYESDASGIKHTVILRKDGSWKVWKEGTFVSLGDRRKYHDFSF